MGILAHVDICIMYTYTYVLPSHYGVYMKLAAG